ncbi:unannotated protein [freshwater metagenome]|uniref:Unannotated protein n=1 Tax=freshwater metagenome TaxID=449393 RepID=A0A6J7KU83_9ZZZZ
MSVGLNLSAAARATAWAAGTLPVKATAWVFSWATSICPTAEPPVSVCTRPEGRPANASMSIKMVSGVSSEGFTMMALPAASAAAACQPNSRTGKLNGTIDTTVPSGSFIVRWTCPAIAGPATRP